MTQGKALRLYLRVNKIPVESFYKKVGTTRQTLNNWFAKETLDEYILVILEKAGVKRGDFLKGALDSEKAALYKEIEALKTENKLLHKLVNALEKK